MKFATKRTWHYPPHLARITTLPWEIKISNFCRYLADIDWLIDWQIAFLIASDFASRSPYSLQIKFFSSLFFYLFMFTINLWHRKFITADVTAVFVNNQHGIQRRGQDLDKKIYLQSMWGMTCYFKHWKYQNLWMNNSEKVKWKRVTVFWTTV